MLRQILPTGASERREVETVGCVRVLDTGERLAVNEL